LSTSATPNPKSLASQAFCEAFWQSYKNRQNAKAEMIEIPFMKSDRALLCQGANSQTHLGN
jgi:hypothetical protein